MKTINTARLTQLVSDDGNYIIECVIKANMDGYGQMASYKGSSSCVCFRNSKGKVINNIQGYSVNSFLRYNSQCKATAIYIANELGIFNNALNEIKNKAKYIKAYLDEYVNGWVEFRIHEFMNNTGVDYETAKSILDFK